MLRLIQLEKKLPIKTSKTENKTRSMLVLSLQKQNVELMLVWCCRIVCDTGLALSQHWFSVLC